ncbi:MAG: hypothetical protein ACK5B9_16420 [Flavobacteriia bacterium]|jgi:hypothetical protein
MKNLLIVVIFFSRIFLYSQDFSDNFTYVGVGVNKYIYGLTPFDIYAYDVNHLSTNTNKYAKFRYAPGIVLGSFVGENSVKGKFEYTFNSKRSDAEYTEISYLDSLPYEIKEKIKVNYAQFKVGVFTSIGKKGNFALATTLDLGVLNNKIKRSGGFYSGKWEKFMTQLGMSNDYRSREFTAGIGLSLNYMKNNFLFTLTRSFTIMDAQYNNVKTLEDFLVNTQHYQFSISYAF